MNSQLSSVGKFYPKTLTLLTFVLGLGLSACSTPMEKGSKTWSHRVSQDLDQEISLKADRSHLTELRKNIPAEKQNENDELALLISKTEVVDQRPSEIRSSFQKIVRKKWSKFRKKTKKLRSDFNKQERKDREKYLKSLKAERKDFMAKKQKSESSKEFFNKQSSERKEFLSNQKEVRAEFESSLKEKQKDFSSYMKDKNNEFNSIMKVYTKRFYDQKREKKEARKEAQRKSVLKSPGSVDESWKKEFKEMKRVKPEPLKAE